MHPFVTFRAFLTWIRQVPKRGAESSAFQAFTGWIIVIQTRSSNAAIHYFILDSAHTSTHHTAVKKTWPHHTFLLLKLRCRKKKERHVRERNSSDSRAVEYYTVCHLIRSTLREVYSAHTVPPESTYPLMIISFCCIASSNLRILERCLIKYSAPHSNNKCKIVIGTSSVHEIN